MVMEKVFMFIQKLGKKLQDEIDMTAMQIPMKLINLNYFIPGKPFNFAFPFIVSDPFLFTLRQK